MVKRFAVAAMVDHSLPEFDNTEAENIGEVRATHFYLRGKLMLSRYLLPGQNVFPTYQIFLEIVTADDAAGAIDAFKKRTNSHIHDITTMEIL